MSLATIGGILLIIGAFATMKGKIDISILVYFVADICWVLMAIFSGDIIGAILTGIGMSLGIIAYYKMHKGKMRRTLDN